MLYAIGTSPYDLLKINANLTFNDNGKFGKYIHIKYDIIQSDCTLFNNKCDAENILKDMKKEDNIVTFKNDSVFSCIEESSKSEPKIEDLKIYRLDVEEVK